MISLKINGRVHQLDVPPDMPLLWAIRDIVGLTGTKFGCGIAQCGACTVHVGGQAVRSCVFPVSAVAGKPITTIEDDDPLVHRLQAAFIAEQVPQCGYCQPGQIMSAAALLKTTPHPSDGQIETALAGNICRCGTYLRIRKAIARAAGAHA
ncbi:MAG: (2Fe-2S)-binding protein [Candidatus Velthaea sp.]|jgi:isoquinoline 1-oxidoreductase alpha subunit